MNEVEKCRDDLIRAIRESQERQRFASAKERIAGNEEARKKIDDFRRKVYLTQNSEIRPDILGDMQNLFNERLQIREDPDVAEYLDAELAYCRMVQKICMRIMNIEDLELDNLMDNIRVDG